MDEPGPRSGSPIGPKSRALTKGFKTKQGLLCRSCAKEPPAFSEACHLGTYDGRLAALIRGLKYEAHRQWGVALGQWLGEALQRRRVRFECVVPVPLDAGRERERGYNQARLVAQGVAMQTGRPLVDALVRIRPTQPQAKLPQAERRKNVKGAFWARDPKKVRGRRIVIIDDVLTTGATAHEAAAALQRAGGRCAAACVAVAQAPAPGLSGRPPVRGFGR